MGSYDPVFTVITVNTFMSKAARAWLAPAALGVSLTAAAQQAEPPDLQPATATATDSRNIRALLVARRESLLSSQIAGRINKITVEHGARFKKGQVLVKFDCVIARAELTKALAEHNAANKTHESNLQLRQHRAVGNLEVDISAARLQKSKADITRSRALVRMCEIYAPFSGRVVKIHVNPFETVTQGQPVIEILDDTRFNMQLNVPSDWLRWLKTGNQFTVTIDETGGQYPATITALGARIDPVSQTLEVEAEIDGSYKDLVAGMSGVARFSIPQ